MAKITDETDPDKDWQAREPKVVMDNPKPVEHYQARENRIEALRAASRIATGAVSIKNQPYLDRDGKKITVGEWVLNLACYFSHYIKTGKMQ